MFSGKLSHSSWLRNLFCSILLYTMDNEKDLEKTSDKFAIIREFEKAAKQSYLLILFCLIKDLYVLLVGLCLLIKPRQVSYFDN